MKAEQQFFAVSDDGAIELHVSPHVVMLYATDPDTQEDDPDLAPGVSVLRAVELCAIEDCSDGAYWDEASEQLADLAMMLTAARRWLQENKPKKMDAPSEVPS